MNKQMTSNGYMSSLKKVPGAVVGAIKSRVSADKQRSGYANNLTKNIGESTYGWRNQKKIIDNTKGMIKSGNMGGAKVYVEDQLRKANTPYTRDALRRGIKFVK